MTTWNDFNDADEQSSFGLIPKGTLVRVRMTIRPGGYDDPHQGWTGGYATRNERTGSVYLNCEFVILDGEYVRRKLWSLIGLHSPRGAEWARMGRALIRACLNSAHGIHLKDESPRAQSARCISGFKDLDGLEFLAKVDWEKDQNGNDKHIIKTAIGPDHADYAVLMGVARPVASATAQTSAPGPSRGSVPTRPSWAQ